MLWPRAPLHSADDGSSMGCQPGRLALQPDGSDGVGLFSPFSLWVRCWSFTPLVCTGLSRGVACWVARGSSVGAVTDVILVVSVVIGTLRVAPWLRPDTPTSWSRSQPDVRARQPGVLCPLLSIWPGAAKLNHGVLPPGPNRLSRHKSGTLSINQY